MRDRAIAPASARTSLPPIDYGPTCYSTGGYCPVSLNNYADYFSTRGTDGANGKGIADYSNRGFFSAGTNLGENSYPQPLNDPANYQLVNTTGIGGRPIQVLLGTVPDPVFSPQQIKLTAPGPWYDFTSTRGISNHFYLTDEVMDDHASLLLPRAVAYTSGLINYIFRGALQIELPDEQVFAAEDFSTAAAPGAGFRTLKLKIKNATQLFAGAAQRTDATTSTGKLIAVVTYRTNTCFKVPSLAGVPYADPADKTGQTIVWDETCRSPRLEDQPLPEIIASETTPAPSGMDDSLQPVTFSFPTAIPFNAVDLDLRVIYRGPLGTESDAIAVGYEFISEPSFLNFDNNRDCRASTASTCKTQPAGPDPIWDSTCTITASVKLPFWNAADQPGWRPVASVTRLLPGQYARVAYLGRSFYHLVLPGTTDIQVTSNQRYPHDVQLTRPDGTTVFYPAKQPVIVPFFRSRKLNGTDQAVMYEADDPFGEFDNTCPDGACGGFDWANTCAPIDPTPQPVTVSFP